MPVPTTPGVWVARLPQPPGYMLGCLRHQLQSVEEASRFQVALANRSQTARHPALQFKRPQSFAPLAPSNKPKHFNNEGWSSVPHGRIGVRIRNLRDGNFVNSRVQTLPTAPTSSRSSSPTGMWNKAQGWPSPKRGYPGYPPRPTSGVDADPVSSYLEGCKAPTP